MKTWIHKFLVIAIAMLVTNLFFVPTTVAQGTMGRWEMCGLSGTTSTVTATGTLANVTFSTLTRGAGLTGSSATNGFSSTGWSTASSLDIAQNDYYEFTITPAEGYKMSITTLKIRDQVSTTSSSFDAYVRYSVDSYGSNLSNWAASTTATNRTINLSGNANLQNRTTPVTFRIYGSDAASSSTTTYRLDCQGTGAGNYRGVDVDGSVAQMAYASKFISMNTGSATWCAGETRNVSVTVKNIGSATWVDGGTPDVNIGLKWNTSGGNWTDYHLRVDAGNLAPGATQTYNFTITASNATIGPVYGTPLSAGTNNLTFDVVKEGDCWFGNNSGTCGPGNSVYVSPNQTITALPTITKGANPSVCQGVTSANLTYSATTGSPNRYSIDYDAAAEAQGFVDVSLAVLPSSPIVMVVPVAAAAGTYNASLTVTNNTTGCTSTAQAIAVTLIASPTVTPGTGPTVCRGITSGLLPYTATNSPNQYSIVYDAIALGQGFANVTNAALPANNINIIIPAAATADVYNGTLTVRNSVTGCVSSSQPFTVTVQAPGVSFTGPTSLCLGDASSVAPTSGGTWISNNPSVASIDNNGDIAALSAGPATFTFTETATGCSATTGTLVVNANSTIALTSAAGTDAQTKCINTAITNITYLAGGGATGISLTSGAFPAGVTGSYNGGTKVFTISGTPTVSGSFSYTLTTAGPCNNVSLSGTIDVTAASSITLTSGAGTNIQTRCINTAITDITYAIGGTATGASITSGALPAGVTGSFDTGVFTITGTPTAAGTFNFTVSSQGPCPLSLTGTITVTADATLALTSAVGTDAQTKCISTAITNITYLVGGSGTGATVTGLPTGVNGTYNSGTKVFTISGTPSVSGTFNYTVNTTGPCVKPSLNGTIVVNANSTITLTSGAGTTVQSVCVNSDITDITYAIGGGGTGASASGLPAGVTGSYNAGVFTITGAPTAAGTFNYTVTTSGPCVNNNLTGTITVNALPTVTIGASPSSICIGNTSTLTATNSGGTASLVYSGSNSTSTAIPDWSASAYSYSTITLAAGASTLAATDLLQVTLNITHGNDADLDIFLVDPSGTRAILLSSDNGGTGNNYTNTVLRTDAATLISSGSAPFTGTFRPEGTITTAPDRTGNYIGGNYNAVVPANALNGAPITGAWSLRIFDDGFSNSGTLTSWSLSITQPGAYSTIFSGPGSFGSVIPGGGSTNTSPSVVVTPPAGVNSYTATTTDAFGCQSTTVVPVNVTVIENATISLTTGNNNQSACFNSPTPISNIVYNVGGGATGAGVTGLPPGVNGTYNAGVFTISGTPTAAGTYNYTVTTTGSCVQTNASGTIIVNTPPSVTFTKTNVSDCGGVPDGTISINATGNGPFSYAWTGVTGPGNPATTAYPDPGNVANITGLKIGFYNVTVTDAVGCQAAITGIHIQFAFAAYVTNNGSISSACGNTGTISLYANAGVQPYTFSLDGINYQPGNTFTNLAAGVYTAYVKDGAGCVITKSITVGAAAPVVVNPFVRPASSCSNDGVIEIYRTGGISPYQYSLDGLTYQVSNKFMNLPAGNYTCYVKDSWGCVGSTATVVTQGATLGMTISKTPVSTCLNNDGTIQVTPTGGTAPYTYSKDGITYQGSNTFSGLASGNYVIYIKDFKGCQGTTNVNLPLNTINVTSNVVDASSCASTNGTVQLFRTGGVGPYTYSLDGNTYQSSTTFTNVAPGTYDGYVKDAKTCIGVQVGIVVGPGCGPVATKNAAPSIAKNSGLKVSANSVLKISAYPNPSADNFTLMMESNSTEKVVITVTDLLGRKLYTNNSGMLNKTYQFGNDFRAGIYILQVVQGTDKQSMKLIKE